MLSYFREDNRCFFLATTFISLAVAYFVKKIASAVRPEAENIKKIDFHTNDTAKYNLKKSNNVNEASKLNIKYKSGDLKQSSNTDAEHSSLNLSEQDKLPLIISALDNLHLASETTMPDEILESMNATSEYKILKNVQTSVTCLEETLASDIEIIPPEEVSMFEIDISSSEDVLTSIHNNISTAETWTSKHHILPSKKVSMSKHYTTRTNILPPEVSKSERDILPSEDVSTSEHYILPLNEVSRSNHYISPLEAPTSKHDILPSEKFSSSKHYILSSGEVSTSKHYILPSEVLTSEHDVIPFEVMPTSKHDILPLRIPTKVPDGLSSDEVPTTELHILQQNEVSPFQLEILSSGISISEPSEISITQIKNSKPLTSELDISLLPDLPSKTQASKHDINKLSEDIAEQSSIVESQTIELNISSTRTFLQEATNPSVSILATEISNQYSQDIKTMTSVEEAVLLNKLHEKESSFINATDINTDKYPLDSIPLEMIYNVLPFSLR